MPLPSIAATRTSAHGLPYLFAGQAQKEAFVNEAFARLDALVQPVVLEERDSPPADPANGDSYLLGEAAAGAWSGQARTMAVWVENQWLFLPPRPGARVHDLDTGAMLHYDPGEGWQRIAPPALPAGGGTQDAEARATLAALIAALRAAGIFSA